MKAILALICGTVFGAGLAMSGMTSTAKVLGFLDLFGDWQPDLLFVMAAATGMGLIGFKLVLGRATPVLDDSFHLPLTTQIDRQLLLGAALFGIGWGIYGYCPGPALAAVVYLEAPTFVFIAAMLAGMWLSSQIKDKI